MKRPAALLVCILLFLPLCACGAERAVPLQCGGVRFTPGEYAFVLHGVLRQTGEDAAREDVIARADNDCRYYAALEQALQNEGLSLSVPHKSQAAARTRGQWQFFAAHYRALGMNKSDLTQLNLWEETEKALTEHLFGPGGKREVKESKLKKRFGETYVGFRSFSEPLTKENAAGETVPLSEKEQTALWETFRALKGRADSGASLDSLFKDYCRSKGLLATTGTEVSVFRQGDPTVTQEFFASVQKLGSGETAVLLNGSNLVLLQRIDLLAPDTPYFAEARDRVLFELKGEQTQKEVRALAEAMQTHTDTQVCNEIYARVRAASQADHKQGARLPDGP